MDGRSRELLVVSAADHAFLGYLRGLLRSLRAAAEPGDLPIAVLDVGLAPEERSWLEGTGAKVVRPGWDVAFEGAGEAPESFKANVARPYLPDHFPGYETYLWLDADCWVQRAEAVEGLREAALRGGLAIVAETDGGYEPESQGRGLRRFLRRTYRESLGLLGARGLAALPPLNVGVFALRADAPHWAAWRRSLARVLARKPSFYAEQVALNHAVVRERLPVASLPASFNWACGHGRPAYREADGLLVHPLPPHEPLHVVHMTSWTKRQPHALPRLEGGTVTRWLTFGGETP